MHITQQEKKTTQLLTSLHHETNNTMSDSEEWNEGTSEENTNRQATREEGSNKEEAKEHAKAPNANKEATIQEEVLTALKIRHVDFSS